MEVWESWSLSERLFRGSIFGPITGVMFFLLLMVQAILVANYFPSIATVVPQFEVAKVMSDSPSIGELVSVTQAGLYVVSTLHIIQLLIAFAIYPKAISIQRGLKMLAIFSWFFSILRGLETYESAICDYFGSEIGYRVCVGIWLIGYTLLDIIIPAFTRVRAGDAVAMSMPGLLLFSIIHIHAGRKE